MCRCAGCTEQSQGCEQRKLRWQLEWWQKKGAGHRDEIKRLTAQRDKFRRDAMLYRRLRRLLQWNLCAYNSPDTIENASASTWSLRTDGVFPVEGKDPPESLGMALLALIERERQKASGK